MRRAEYDQVEVPVPLGTRILKIAFASVFCIVGLFLMTDFFVANPSGAGALGLLFFALGAAALYQWRGPTEFQLTEAGKAAKAADEAKAKAIAEEREFRQMVGFSGLFLVCLFVYWAPDMLDSLRDKVRVYAIVCQRLPQGRCTWKADSVVSFGVFPNQQTVVVQILESTRPVGKLANCAVVDRVNWTCTRSPDPSSDKVHMHDGTFVDDGSDPTSVLYVPRYKFWQVKLGI